MAELSAAPISRRERARADTVREIKQTARPLLVAHGVEGLGLRAVAREMGMTAPRSTATSPASRTWSSTSSATSTTSWSPTSRPPGTPPVRRPRGCSW